MTLHSCFCKLRHFVVFQGQSEYGISDPLTGDMILAKNKYTKPGKPRNMEAVDIGAESLTLQFEPPTDDGKFCCA